MKITKIIRPFTILHLEQIEAWLKKQSLNGYMLVDLKGWSFSFVECSPRQREYFLYVSPFLEKNDRFLAEFYFIRNLYYLRKSLLNKKRNLNIFEADISKLDQGYFVTRKTRTKHYLKYHIKLLLLKVPLLIAALWLSAFEKLFFLISLICIALIIYSIISIFNLK